MDVLTFETCWALNNEIIKQVKSFGLSLFNYQDEALSNKHKIYHSNLINAEDLVAWNSEHTWYICLNIFYKRREQ